MPSMMSVILIGAAIAGGAVIGAVLLPILTRIRKLRADDAKIKDTEAKEGLIDQIRDDPALYARNERNNVLSSPEYVAADALAESMEEQSDAAALQMQEQQELLRLRPGLANWVLVLSFVTNLADIVMTCIVLYSSMGGYGVLIAPALVLASTLFVCGIKHFATKDNGSYAHSNEAVEHDAQNLRSVPVRIAACVWIVGIVLLAINFIILFNNAGERTGIIYDGKIKEAHQVYARIENNPEKALDPNHDSKLDSAQAKIDSLEAEKERVKVMFQGAIVVTYLVECLSGWFILDARNTQKFEKMRKAWERNRRAQADALHRRDGIFSDKLNETIQKFQELGIDSNIAMREFGRDVRFAGASQESHGINPLAREEVFQGGTDTDALQETNMLGDISAEFISVPLD